MAAQTGGIPEVRTVRTTMATAEPLTRRIPVSGTLAAEEQVALAFKVAGRVADVHADLGDRVRRDQVVASLVTTDFELRIKQAEAALMQARVRLGLPPHGDDDRVDPEETSLARQRRALAHEARLHRDRMNTFVERGLSARAELDAAEAALEVADGQFQDALEEIWARQAILAQRRSELEIARQQLIDAVLRSPIDGAVRERHVSPGDYRTPGTPVLTIVRTDPLRLQLAVPERDIAALRVGQAVRVHVEGGSTVHTGRLERIGAAISETNRTLPVEAFVPNPDGALTPGQFANAEIVISDDDRALVVPGDALVTFAGVQKVFVVEDGRAHERRIRTGRREGDRIEIVEGLLEGALVVRAPGDLVDGTAVAPVAAE